MPLFLPTLLVLCVVAIIVQSDVLSITVWSLIAAYVVLRAWTRRSTGALAVERRVNGRAFVGEVLDVSLRVRNTGLLPIPWLEMNETLPMELQRSEMPAEVLSLGPRAEREVHYTVRCRRRGYYDIGPLRIWTGDLLGIERQLTDLPSVEHLIVYPRIVPLQRLHLPTSSALVALPAHLPLYHDPSRVVGVREYMPTDSLRRIHWTATARLGQIMVKEYQPSIARSTTYCLDLNLRSYEAGERHHAVELAITAAASLAHHTIMSDRLAANLVTEAFDPLEGRVCRIATLSGARSAHLMSILEALARVRAAPTEDFALLFQKECAALPAGSTIVAITGMRSASLDHSLLQAARLGLAVALIVVSQELGSAPLARVPTYRVWNDADLVAV